MQKLGSGFVTNTSDVDCLEFDMDKVYFLSEPLVTGAKGFSFGVAELRLEKVTPVTVIRGQRKSSISLVAKANRWSMIKHRLKSVLAHASTSRPTFITRR